ncbi:glutamine dumper 2-like protein [Tanacetum coccineum]
MSSSSTKTSTFWRLDELRVIDLFTGIAVMLAMIVVVLVVLACSQRNMLFDPTNDFDVEMGKIEKIQDTGSPKTVVIMAGDNVPTYIATPSVVN